MNHSRTEVRYSSGGTDGFNHAIGDASSREAAVGVSAGTFCHLKLGTRHASEVYLKFDNKTAAEWIIINLPGEPGRERFNELIKPALLHSIVAAANEISATCQFLKPLINYYVRDRQETYASSTMSTLSLARNSTSPGARAIFFFLPFPFFSFRPT